MDCCGTLMRALSRVRACVCVRACVRVSAHLSPPPWAARSAGSSSLASSALRYRRLFQTVCGSACTKCVCACVYVHVCVCVCVCVHACMHGWIAATSRTAHAVTAALLRSTVLSAPRCAVSPHATPRRLLQQRVHYDAAAVYSDYYDATLCNGAQRRGAAPQVDAVAVRVRRCEEVAVGRKTERR